METSPDRAVRPDAAPDPQSRERRDDGHPGTVPRFVVGRRRTTLVVLAVVAALSAAALVAALLSWAPDQPAPPRALTGEERERLAAMRVTNYRDLRAGVHVTAGAGAARTEL
ncbi:hypothetical protein NCC78_13145, partial [Micromonospora phytophila]|nr:hypothetical protein [Micromonospora phytophila]